MRACQGLVQEEVEGQLELVEEEQEHERLLVAEKTCLSQAVSPFLDMEWRRWLELSRCHDTAKR